LDKKAVRLGIIGAGLAVELLHWPPLSKMGEEFPIVVTCDIDLKAAQKTAEMVGGCRYTNDYREVLAAEDVDAVLLSLPIHLAAQFILDAVQAGKHVICEKPIAANLEQGRELVQKLKAFAPGTEKGRGAGEKGVVLEIAENFHYRKDIAKAKEWMAAGRIGTPFLIELTSHFWTDTNSGFASTPWRQDNQYRGGVLADAAVHHAAALRELGGAVEQLQAFTKSVHPIMGGLDTLVLNLRYQNGALGHLVFAGAAKGGSGPYASMYVYGTEGAISIADGKVSLSKQNLPEETFSDPDHDGGYMDEFRNFYQAITQGQQVVATLEEGYKDWELIMRALDSAEERQVVLFS